MNYTTYIKQLEAYYPHSEASALVRTALCDVLDMPFEKTLLVDSLTHEQESKINEIIERLKAYEPIQYILGHTLFYGLEIECRKGVLIPRPETELLVEKAVEAIKYADCPSVLEFGTGTGAISVAIAKECPLAKITATDISPDALATARLNFDKHGVTIDLKNDDMLNSQVVGDFDIIVSNPPYITLTEKAEMHANVLDYEPHIALFVPEEKAMIFNDSIAKFAALHLKKGGLLLCEINQYLATEVESVFRANGLQEVATHKDIFNNPRVTIGKKY